MAKIDKLRTMAGKMIPQEPEDLIINRVFVDPDGTRGPTLKIIVHQADMTQSEIDIANSESQAAWDLAMEELS